MDPNLFPTLPAIEKATKKAISPANSAFDILLETSKKSSLLPLIAAVSICSFPDIIPNIPLK